MFYFIFIFYFTERFKTMWWPRWTLNTLSFSSHWFWISRKNKVLLNSVHKQWKSQPFISVPLPTPSAETPSALLHVCLMPAVSFTSNGKTDEFSCKKFHPFGRKYNFSAYSDKARVYDLKANADECALWFPFSIIYIISIINVDPVMLHICPVFIYLFNYFTIRKHKKALSRII